MAWKVYVQAAVTVILRVAKMLSPTILYIPVPAWPVKSTIPAFAVKAPPLVHAIDDAVIRPVTVVVPEGAVKAPVAPMVTDATDMFRAAGKDVVELMVQSPQENAPPAPTVSAPPDTSAYVPAKVVLADTVIAVTVAMSAPIVYELLKLEL